MKALFYQRKRRIGKIYDSIRKARQLPQALDGRPSEFQKGKPSMRTIRHVIGGAVIAIYYFGFAQIPAEATTVTFAGRTWNVRNWGGGPPTAGNNWSDSTSNVWVDPQGYLHLKITNVGGKWYCAEVDSADATTYGMHRFYLNTRIDQLDANVTFSPFVYYYDGSPHEIDIEFSQWGVWPFNYNSQYVVQPPPYTSANLFTFTTSLNGDYSTHYFNWQPSSILFKSIHGHYLEPPDSSYLIQQWTSTAASIPSGSLGLKIIINLYLKNGSGQPPSNGQEVEMIVQDLDYPPISPTAAAASSVTTTSFTGNWNASSRATGYYLDVSTSSSFGSYVSGYQGLDVGNVTSRSVTGLAANTIYYYRIRAYNANGISLNSGTSSVTTAQNPIAVTVQTSPSGRSFSVDGTPYTSGQTFSWTPGANHTIATTSPQSGGTGVQYVWSSWSDGGAISHTVGPTSATTYTANFAPQYYLTLSYGTGGSRVSPGSGWYNSGTSVGISATAASGYSFSSWKGSGTGSYSGSTSSPTITMNGPISETANFTQNPILVTVQPNPSGRSFTVDGTAYTTSQTFSWTPGANHTIATTSPQSGGTGIQYIWGNWSDGGAISHAVAPSGATTYTANFTTQYYLTMNSGTGGAVGPSSGWWNSSANVSINATPSSRYSFNGWTGSGSGSYSGNSNPASVTMNGPITETAIFSQNSICSATNHVLGISRNLDETLSLNFVGTPGAQYCVVSQTNVSEPIPAWAVLPNTTTTVTNPSGLWFITVTNSRHACFYRSKALWDCGQDASLLGWWKFNEGSGSTAYDYSGNTNIGTIYGATWVAGQPGFDSALSFNGSSGYVDVPNSSSLNPTAQISIAAWLNASSWSCNPRVLEKGDWTDNQYMLIGYQGGGNVLWFKLSGVTPPDITWPEPTTNSWHHAAATYDGSYSRLFVDGLLVTQHVASGSINIDGDDLRIGAKASNPGPCDYFNGTMDDVRLYSRALTPVEVAALAGATITAGLGAYFPFAGNTVDASGNGHDAANYGAILTTNRLGSPNAAYAYDGSSAYMSVGAPASLQTSNSLTIAAWVNFYGVGGQNPRILSIAGNYPDQSLWGYEFLTQGAGDPRGLTFYYGNQYVNSISKIPGSSWHFVAAVGTPNSLAIYIDGVLDVTTNVPALYFNYAASPMYVGRKSASPDGTDNWSGALGAIRIYTRSLSATEVQWLYYFGQ